MDSKVGFRAEGMSNLHLHVARVLRDQLDDLLTRNSEANGIRSTLEFAAQHILVSGDPFRKISVGTQRRGPKMGFKRGPGMGQSSSGEVMDPEIWKTLPSHLLHLLLAQLPVPDIKRLRILSKDWKRSVDMPWSEFRQVCEAEARSSRFALICPGDKDGKFSVNTFDLRTCRWHAFTYTAPPGRSEVTICACDGGLVCFLLKTRERCPQVWPPEECISVWNPLTGDECLLPGFGSVSPEGAVKLSVDRETKSFKVMVMTTVLRRRNRGEDESQTYQVAHVYDSVTRDWEKVISSDVFMFNSHCCAGPALREGFFNSLVAYASPNAMKGILAGVCTYDPAEGKLKNKLHYFNQPEGKSVLRSTTFAEEHFFLLFSVRDPPLYGIRQYRYNGEYTRVKSYRCPPLDKLPQQRPRMKLDACKGFVIVSAHLQQPRWLLDLSTGAWRHLPPLAEDMMESDVEYVMCELQWSVVPKSRYQEWRESMLKEVSERKPVQK